MAAKKASKLQPTKNDLPQKTRAAVIPLLQQSLAEAFDLLSHAKQAHWNIKGPNFISLHKLFDEIAETVTEYVDELAERLVELGGLAHGTVKAAAKASKLPDYPLEITQEKKHIQALLASLAAYAKNVRADIDAADQAGDADTADLFTEISRGIDKYVWFVEAHMQN